MYFWFISVALTTRRSVLPLAVSELFISWMCHRVLPSSTYLTQSLWWYRLVDITVSDFRKGGTTSWSMLALILPNLTILPQQGRPYIIAKMLMMQGSYRFYTFYDLDLMDLKALGRFYQKTIKQRTRLKIQLTAYVDEVFPELQYFFKSVCIRSLSMPSLRRLLHQRPLLPCTWLISQVYWWKTRVATSQENRPKN